MIKVDRSSIKSIMELANIEPSKSKGQNFLVDDIISEKIVNLLKNDAKSSLIEVGPGLGSLTYFLQQISENLSVVEVDDRANAYLKSTLDDEIKIYHKDALTHDFSNYEYVISNIPYNITKELIVYLLKSAVNAKQFVFMCQKENFAHFANTSGSEYGPASVLVHLVGNIKKAFDVPPSSFVPAPKCVSTVFTIDVFEGVDRSNIYDTYLLVDKLFRNRRKTILNNLSDITGKDKAMDLLTKLNIKFTARPEEISPKQYFELHNLLLGIR